MLQIRECEALSDPSEYDAKQKLSRLHRQVISIAIAEAGRVRRRPPILAQILSSLGMRDRCSNSLPLANEGLEALRQFVCLCRQNDGAACDFVPRLLKAGLSPIDIAGVATAARTS